MVSNKVSLHGGRAKNIHIIIHVCAPERILGMQLVICL